jgi:hypothetical protein
MLENREASLGMRPAKRGESDNVTTTLCQNRTVPGRRETASPGLEPATGAGTPGRAQGAHSAARHPALDASPQTTQTTPNGQCFSASVLQCFSISVFQYFSISAFPPLAPILPSLVLWSSRPWSMVPGPWSLACGLSFLLSTFYFLLFQFQVSSLILPPVGWSYCPRSLVFGPWSFLVG